MISEFPLFCFTTLAGLGAGAYAVNAVFPMAKSSKRAWLFPFACMILLAIGLLGLPMHLGRPERMLIALTQPSAMIAQEAYWSIALGIVLLVDTLLVKFKGRAPRALSIVGAVFALVLMFVMGNAYFVSLAIPAWASWATFLLFVCGDFAMGAALAFLLDNVLSEGKGEKEADTASRQTMFSNARIVLAALALVSLAIEAVHFSNVGLSFAPFAASAVIAAAGIGAIVAARMGKLTGKAAVWAEFVCLFAAVAIARYAFYAACVL
ncbi:MAG: dimethyl sulfoxide reductase anchor subunit [Slackia sp.]|nr:dimethyl sulfoxide reductase anchor subunit [Slackia sp.]